MPGGGQLWLARYGKQNIIVNANPEETKFYKVFKRYTHFGQESYTIPLEGVNELNMDTPVRIRAKIPRHADLITDLTFVFDLPEVYSKIYDGYMGGFNPETEAARIPAFRWIHMIGALIIDNLAIYVGGTRVQEFPGEWIGLRATLDMPADRYLKWRAMVGDVPELTEPEWGVYGKSPNYPWTKGEYPHNVTDVCGNIYAPSLPARRIRVPLPFWFSESWGRALPLVALQYHEVEVQITLRPLREIYRIMDPVFQAEPLRPYRMLLYNPAYPIQTDTTFATPPYDNLTLQNVYQSNFTDGAAAMRNYFVPTTPTIATPTNDSFAITPHLEANYIYLTEKEQVMFASRELQYLVQQVQLFRFQSVGSRYSCDLDVHGLLTRLVFFGRRSDAIESRNDYINFSNWKRLTQAPYIPGPMGTAQPNSGVAIPYYGQRDIIQSARVLVGGNEMAEERPAGYYENQTAFMNVAGKGVAGLTPGALKPDEVMGPLYVVPFALNTSDHDQPSGSFNTSLVRNVQLEVNPAPLDPAGYYTYDITVYAETLNTIKFMSGMAGLSFAI
jgi:hypothetical protein